jgi:hypothetical protein
MIDEKPNPTLLNNLDHTLSRSDNGKELSGNFGPTIFAIVPPIPLRG